MAKRLAADILRAARETLAMARGAYDDLSGSDPTRRQAGLRSVAIYGRAVISILENLRGIDRVRFNQWYAPHKAEIQSDPLIGYFTRLRNEMLKEGVPPNTTVGGYIKHLNSEDIYRAAPPGATAFFVGDETGGSGWVIRLPNGREVREYIDLPESIGGAWMELSEPREHQGRPITNTKAQHVASIYVGYLERLLDEAEREFR